MNLPKKCIVDTNVPKTANLYVNRTMIRQELLSCVLGCIEAIEHVTQNGVLVIDSENEIFNEYRHQLSMKGQPGIGDSFMKWVHDNRWKSDYVERISITKKENSYLEFPVHNDLTNFDDSDRKFVAVANAHPEKPPILQATDSKWWGWKDALEQVGITVHFICPEYIRTKYRKKTRK